MVEFDAGFFQKQSPLLNQFNYFIHLAKEMGLILKSYYTHLPNATKCNTITDMLQSHAEQNQKATVEVNDIYGMLVLLGLGLCVAHIVLLAELTLLVSKMGNLILTMSY